MPKTLVHHFSVTKASMALSIGILSFLNGVTIPKVFSSPHLNNPILSDMTNTTNGYASSSLLMTYSLLEAMILLFKNTLKILLKVTLTLNSLAQHNGSYNANSPAS
jgi:hypothetical protein